MEGGSDTDLKNIYIASLKPRSAAFINGQLQRGDQIIMCGNECLVGVTSLEAWDILNKAPLIVEIVVARKKESITQLRSSISETPLSAHDQPIEQKPQFTHNRRHSLSLHFSGSSYQRSSFFAGNAFKRPQPSQRGLFCGYYPDVFTLALTSVGSVSF